MAPKKTQYLHYSWHDWQVAELEKQLQKRKFQNPLPSPVDRGRILRLLLAFRDIPEVVLNPAPCTELATFVIQQPEYVMASLNCIFIQPKLRSRLPQVPPSDTSYVREFLLTRSFLSLPTGDVPILRATDAQIADAVNVIIKKTRGTRCPRVTDEAVRKERRRLEKRLGFQFADLVDFYLDITSEMDNLPSQLQTGHKRQQRREDILNPHPNK